MKTKIIFSVLTILLLSTFNIYSQDCYLVIKIKGTVYNSTKGKDVSVNDELCSSDNLVFKSSNSVIVVHSGEKGRFTLKSKAKDSKSEFACVMNDILKQAGTGNLSSRAVLSLKDEFTGDYYIVGSLIIKVEDKEYPINENTFFYLRYKYQGEDINKKLAYSNDSLIFELDNIFKLNDKIVNQDEIDEVTLYYYDKLNQISKKISSFRLTFLDISEIKSEIQKIIDIANSSNKSREDIYKEVLSYMSDTYGNFNVESFEKFYLNNF